MSADTNGVATDDAGDEQHWFAGRNIDVLLYKVNRRDPAGGPTLGERPEDVVQHLQEVLATSPTATTGHRHKRDWKVGDKAFDSTSGIFTGRLGWMRSDDALETVWDEGSQSWIDQIERNDVSAVAPFAFLRSGRFLGVLRHPTFTETNVADAITEMLNKGEQARPIPATVWAVEPVGDAQQFEQWMESTDKLLALEFVFRRPNPSADSAFEDLFERLDSLEAERIKEQIVAAPDSPGLNKAAVATDPVTRAFIAAAMAAFGYLVGRGVRNGHNTTYDQRDKVARERVNSVGPSWDDALGAVVEAVARARRRRE